MNSNQTSPSSPMRLRQSSKLLSNGNRKLYTRIGMVIVLGVIIAGIVVLVKHLKKKKTPETATNNPAPNPTPSNPQNPPNPPSPPKPPVLELSHPIFKFLDFHLNQFPYHVALDVWGDPLNNPDYSKLEYRAKSKDTLEEIKKLIPKLPTLSNVLLEYTKKEKSDWYIGKVLKDKINIENTFTKLLLRLVNSFEIQFNPEKEIDLQQFVLRLILSEHFFGQIFKIKRYFFVCLDKHYLKDDKTEYNKKILEDHKDLFKEIQNYMKSLYEEIPLYFSNEKELKNFVEGKDKKKFKDFLWNLTEYITAIMHYDNFYYLGAFFNTNTENGNVKVIVKPKFKEMFSLDGDDDYEKFEKDFKEISMKLKKIKEYQKEILEEEDPSEHINLRNKIAENRWEIAGIIKEMVKINEGT